MTDLDDSELPARLQESLSRAAAPVRGAGLQADDVFEAVARRRRTRSRIRVVLAATAAAAVATTLVLVQPERDRLSTENDPLVTSTDGPTRPETSGQSSTSTTDSTTSTIVTTTTPTPTTTVTPAEPEFPPERTSLEHGGPTWGLYLAVAAPGDYESPVLQAATAAATAAGYRSGPGDLSCDQGAAEALGVEAGAVGVALYFETEAQANQARAAFEAEAQEVVGVVNVTTYCMD